MNNIEENKIEEIKGELTSEEKNLLHDEIFEKMKLALIDEKRLLGRFIEFCKEYTGFEYDEMGENMEEADDVLRKCDKIRDKFLLNIETKLLYIFSNVKTNTLTQILTFELDTKDAQFKVILEVMPNSFNLEII